MHGAGSFGVGQPQEKRLTLLDLGEGFKQGSSQAPKAMEITRSGNTSCSGPYFESCHRASFHRAGKSCADYQGVSRSCTPRIRLRKTLCALYAGKSLEVSCPLQGDWRKIPMPRGCTARAWRLPGSCRGSRRGTMRI